jgi:malate dehydrogenase
MDARPTIAIIGAGGGVGSSLAYTLAVRELAGDLILIDDDNGSVNHLAMDLEQLHSWGIAANCRIGAGPDALEASIIVITASIPQGPHASRMDLLTENVVVLERVAASLGPCSTWPGVIVVVTNPVDPLVTLLQRTTALDRYQVLGYTINDSVRLRFALAQALGVSPHRVGAWAIGEHGEHCVPLLDHVTLDGRAIDLDPQARAYARDYLEAWYARWMTHGYRRTSRWTSGVGVAQMVRALRADHDTQWTTSLVLMGEYGISGLALSVPVTLRAGRVATVNEWDLSTVDRAKLAEAASHVADGLVQLEDGD